MKKILKKINTWESALHCYDEDGNIIDVSYLLSGNVSNLSGDVSNLSGNVSYLLSGDVSNLRGDVSNLRGDVSNLSGDVSNLSGDVDDCEITAEERTAGVDVSDLVG